MMQIFQLSLYRFRSGYGGGGLVSGVANLCPMVAVAPPVPHVATPLLLDYIYMYTQI